MSATCERIRRLCAGMRVELERLRAETGSPVGQVEILEAQINLLALTACVNRAEREPWAPSRRGAQQQQHGKN